MNVDKESLLNLLEEIEDPEIPVLNIVEMGIVRGIDFVDEKIVVKITPTYSGCPAMKTIENQILDILFDQGFPNSHVKTVYTPAWTTDWLSDETKSKLRDYGIAPPKGKSEDDFLQEVITKPVQCPFCESKDTILKSEFGSTACKALHYCNNCSQPFEYFKCI
ncbi:MAG: phenylacetate-CoA oxygenase subunit PaaJ [Melioribacteraceae bacterium]|nr:phenylacetate-CoA oxygenase subunit PaaJ [Melioribacteraceae bacterium]MCF8354888.1 phenylacetate-CoA oxygenase subunit PaaJ [Melioribacteraceae bacterium]MCF8393890.1 phenylacetate-CoA oxygenase subunit PaaJ [Melioribacteraceae bacterium]MCF8419662.1 phenylacetate-CoA oxygenase subunit PaaJ [Melioribacteraceae bacterium]